MRALFLLFDFFHPRFKPGISGGREALVVVTTDWIANDQSLHRDLIEVTLPDRRIPIAKLSIQPRHQVPVYQQSENHRSRLRESILEKIFTGKD